MAYGERRSERRPNMPEKIGQLKLALKEEEVCMSLFDCYPVGKLLQLFS